MSTTETTITLVCIEYLRRGAKNEKPSEIICPAELQEGVMTFYHNHPGVVEGTVKMVQEETIKARLFERALKAQNALNRLSEEHPVYPKADQVWTDTFQEFTHYFGRLVVKVTKEVPTTL